MVELVHHSPTPPSAVHAPDGARTGIPQELVDYTIDFLHDDISTLLASSLVSRRWLPASSSHLFACMRWPPCKHQWDLWARGIGDACKCHFVGDTGTLEELLLLLSSTPRICDNVRDLRITMSWPKRGGSWTDRHYIFTSPHQLVAILNLVPSVSRLKIMDLRFGPQASLISFHAVRRLEELTLIPFLHHRDIDYHCITNFLSYFQAISTLVVRFQMRQRIDVLPNLLLSAAPPTQVSRLGLHYISNQYGSVWLSLLLERLDMASLTSLFWEDSPLDLPENSPLTPAFHNFFRHCTNLRSLACHRGTFRRLISYPSSCPTLQHLHFIGVCAFVASGVRRTDWDAIPEIMACPLASTVQDFTLDFTFSRGVSLSGFVPISVDRFQRQLRATLESLDWTALNDSCRRLRSLTMEIKIRLPGEVRREGQDREMCRTMVENFVKDHLLSPAQLNFGRVSQPFITR